MKKLMSSFLCGILFALGLGISGMTEASNIVGFLDITGDWKPQLIFVMLGALTVNIILFQWVIKRDKPLFDKKFFMPENKQIDSRLILGASLFGLGWGLTGLCPGPGVVSLVSGQSNVVIYIIAMIAGMFFAQKLFVKKS